MKLKSKTINGYHRLLAVVLTLSLLFTACSEILPTPAATPTPAPMVQHFQGKFSEIAYARPDVDAIYKTMDQALADTKAGGKQDETLKLYSDIVEMLLKYDNMQSTASIRNDMDLSDELYDTESTYLDQEYPKLDNRMLELTGAILDSGYGDAARKSWGKDYVDRYEINKKLNSKEIEPLSDRETELINEYKKLASQEYTTILDGKTVTLDDLDYSSPAAVKPYYEIVAQRNKELGQIYRDLVKLRVEVAKMLGFESYTDYAYALLGRDYTKEEAQAFSARVKETIPPLVAEIKEVYQEEVGAARERNEVDLDIGIPTLQKALKEEYPAGMNEALTYMLENEMYHFSDQPNTASGAYSTILSAYRAPFLFVNTKEYSGPNTVFHEFGHYYNFYNSDCFRWNDSYNLDMAEIHSQGLELLMHKVYPELYGEDADLFIYASLVDVLDGVLSGCLEDEFQQKVFENPEMSLDEMNELHAELSAEYYGYPQVFEWVEIHHHFETPFYYISYATSAVSALEIWELAEKDRAATMGIYDKITQYTVNVEYRKSLTESGLSDPFTSSCLEQIVAALRKEMKLDDLPVEEKKAA